MTLYAFKTRQHWGRCCVPLTVAAALTSAAAFAPTAQAGPTPTLSATFTLGAVSVGSTARFAYQGGTSSLLTLVSGDSQTFTVGSYSAIGLFGSGKASGAPTGSLAVAYTPSGGTSGTVTATAPYAYNIIYSAAGGGLTTTTLTVFPSSAATYTLNDSSTLTFTVDGANAGANTGGPSMTFATFTALYTAAGGAAAGPEPGSLAMLAFSGLPVVGMIARRRRKTRPA